jgi:hypothetical protein
MGVGMYGTATHTSFKEALATGVPAAAGTGCSRRRFMERQASMKRGGRSTPEPERVSGQFAPRSAGKLPTRLSDKMKKKKKPATKTSLKIAPDVMAVPPDHSAVLEVGKPQRPSLLPTLASRPQSGPASPASPISADPSDTARTADSGLWPVSTRSNATADTGRTQIDAATGRTDGSSDTSRTETSRVGGANRLGKNGSKNSVTSVGVVMYANTPTSPAKLTLLSDCPHAAHILLLHFCWARITDCLVPEDAVQVSDDAEGPAQADRTG